MKLKLNFVFLNKLKYHQKTEITHNVCTALYITARGHPRKL